MKRVFVGLKISLSPEFQQAFDQLKEKLKNEQIRWESTDKLHVTLCFIGDVSSDQLERVCEILQQVSEGQNDFSFQLKNLSYFKKRGVPAVVFFDVTKGDALAGLASQIKNKLDEAGINTNPRFNPHVTLCRLKKLKNKPAFYEVMDQVKETPVYEVVVRKISLFESILKPTGSEYKILQEFCFS